MSWGGRRPSTTGESPISCKMAALNDKLQAKVFKPSDPFFEVRHEIRHVINKYLYVRTLSVLPWVSLCYRKETCFVHSTCKRLTIRLWMERPKTAGWLQRCSGKLEAVEDVEECIEWCGWLNGALLYVSVCTSVCVCACVCVFSCTEEIQHSATVTSDTICYIC